MTEKHIKPLFGVWCQKILPLVYDESLSYYEVLCRVQQKLNEVIESQNNLQDEFYQLKTWIDTQLESYTKDYLNEMLNKGELSEIINDLYNKFETDLNSLETNLQSQINTLNNDKLNKNQNESITLGMLTQEVKESMTGGSTAVVGKNSVNTSNIVDKAVTIMKLSDDLRKIYKIDSYNPKWNQQFYINNSGILSSSEQWSATDLIPVYDYNILYVKGTFSGITGGYSIAYYSTDYNYNSQQSDMAFKKGVIYSEQNIFNDYTPIIIPENVSYIRLCTQTTQVSSIEIQLLNIDKFFVEKEYSLNNPGFINTTGEITKISNWFTSDYIPVVGGSYFQWDISYSGAIDKSVGYVIAMYDNLLNFIGGIIINNPDNITYLMYKYLNIFVNENAYFVRICQPNSIPNYTGEVNIRISEYDNLIIQTRSKQSSNIIRVSKSGNGDYTSINEAVKNAKSGDIIYVASGTYIESVEAWGKELYIIGENMYDTILTNSNDDYSNPPLEMSCGTLENLSVIQTGNSGSTHAYCIHSEDDFSFNKSFTIRNCYIENAPNSAACIGFGMRGNQKILFDNVVFKKETHGLFYIHDSNKDEYVGENEIIFKNCEFHYKQQLIGQFQTQSKSGADVKVNFINNLFYNPNVNYDNQFLGLTIFRGDTTYSYDIDSLENWNFEIGYGNSNPFLNNYNKE